MNDIPVIFQSIYNPLSPLVYTLKVYNEFGKKIQHINVVDTPYMKFCGYNDREIEKYKEMVRKDTDRETI